MREPLHEGQADSGTFVGARALALNAVETLEDVRQIAFRDPDSGVGDPELHRATYRTKGNLDRAFERELECIGEQVEDDLLPHVAIDVDGVGELLAVGDEREPGVLDR